MEKNWTFLPSHSANSYQNAPNSRQHLSEKITAENKPVISKHAGLDASIAYNSVHSPTLISKTLSPSKRIGKVSSSTPSYDLLKPPPTESAQPALSIASKPPLSSLINAYDFEAVAEKTVSYTHLTLPTT